MGRPPLPQNIVRKNIALDADFWVEINEERKRVAGAVPSEADLVRTLLREAMDARYAIRKRKAAKS
jgi:hypothetical protein